jgi:hypothetical protein
MPLQTLFSLEPLPVSEQPTNGESINLVLVHGTWSDGPLASICDAFRRWLSLKERQRSLQGDRFWYQSGHLFVRRLVDELRSHGFEPALYSCLWTGMNSFGARLICAAGLATGIESEKFPRRRTIVLGHSHGGSAAFLAVNHLKEPSGVELVTMATPFVRLEPCTSGRAVSLAFSGWFMTLVAALFTFTAWRTGANAYNPISIERLMPLLFPLVVLVCFMKARERIAVKYIRENVLPWQTAFRGSRIQCIRGMSDEANLAISAGLIGLGIARLLSVLIGKVGTSLWVQGLGLLALFAALTAAFIARPIPFLLVGALGVPALGGIAVYLLSFLQWLMGSEAAWSTFSFMGSLDSCPDVPPGKLEVLTLPAPHATLEGVRHGIYQQPECVKAIVDGIIQFRKAG